MIIGTGAVDKVLQRLTAPTGVNARLVELTSAQVSAAAPIPERQIFVQNVTSDIAERALDHKYPAMHVYCEAITNELREKFRTFSGTVVMVIEIRLSQDRLDELERKLQLYVDAITQVLGASRGDWGDGMFYAGAYKVVFHGVRRGGKHFIQTAKITFEIGVSRN